MGFNYGHQHLSEQQQEILRKKAREEKKRRDESEEKKRLLETEIKIIDYLTKIKEPESLNEIQKGVRLDILDVSKSLRSLEKRNSISSVIIVEKTSEVNSLHYFIKTRE